MYSEDIDIKDLEKYFLASSQGQAPGFSPKNFITQSQILQNLYHHHIHCYCSRINQCLWQSPEVDGFHEAIPVWERAYAVSKTKRCVEGAAGTRGADKHFTETPLDELAGHTLRL